MATYRQQLRELAYDTHGVITLSDAKAAGVPAVEVRKLANRGALEHRGHGVYRMLEAPVTPMDEFAEAVALAGDGAVLADEAVLAAHDLAQVNLRTISVATNRRIRAKLPATVNVIHKNVTADQRDDIDGIPAMSVEAALLAVRGRIMADRLVDAAHRATARGLVPPAREAQLVHDLATA
ncbi:type IV toxin-antitoxin system AbiEi family antitoxin domain-containing protein [Pedococcus bigeumensis]|uniref:type IV toxin-antitoxin system AbiEi family antitoxin domain-containing protein n=1 Tax=Pedococcus bigeumensis TaxID=433644 RepID=UPI002FE88390